MNLARRTTKGQMTIPRRVREIADLREGDVVSLDVEKGVVIVRKLTPATDSYLEGVEETLFTLPKALVSGRVRILAGLDRSAVQKRFSEVVTAA